jgi:hypothetical protein
MSARRLLVNLLIWSIVSCSLVLAQDSKPPAFAEAAASPEMDRVAKVFVGDWNTSESMERSEFFPNGGGRHGTSHWRLAVGGTTLVGEGHSDGSAGPLSYLITIWWDKNSKLYYFLTCFKDTGSSCKVRGTAHWEGDNFVNDYEELEHGKPTKWRDSFIQITPTSHTLIAARDAGDGTMKTLITTKSKRHGLPPRRAPAVY